MMDGDLVAILVAIAVGVLASFGYFNRKKR
jgi:hypothetical protein